MLALLTEETGRIASSGSLNIAFVTVRRSRYLSDTGFSFGFNRWVKARPVRRDADECGLSLNVRTALPLSSASNRNDRDNLPDEPEPVEAYDIDGRDEPVPVL